MKSAQLCSQVLGRYLGLRFFVAVALTLATANSNAAVSLVEGDLVVTGGENNPGGTLVEDLTTFFSDPLGFFSGRLRTLVVRTDVETFDFYYQITNTSQDPSEFLDGIVTGNFAGFSTSVLWSLNGLDGIAGAASYEIGNVESLFATRDQTPSDDVTFYFPFTSLDGEISSNISKFLVVRTDAKGYSTTGTARIAGAGLSNIISVFGPSNTPSTSVPDSGTLLPLFAVVVSGIFYFDRKKPKMTSKTS